MSSGVQGIKQVWGLDSSQREEILGENVLYPEAEGKRPNSTTLPSSRPYGSHTQALALGEIIAPRCEAILRKRHVPIVVLKVES